MLRFHVNDISGDGTGLRDKSPGRHGRQFEDIFTDLVRVLDFVAKEDFKMNPYKAHLQITEVVCLFGFETRSQCAAMELTLQTRLASNSQNIPLLLSPKCWKHNHAWLRRDF